MWIGMNDLSLAAKNNNKKQNKRRQKIRDPRCFCLQPSHNDTRQNLCVKLILQTTPVQIFSLKKKKANILTNSFIICQLTAVAPTSVYWLPQRSGRRKIQVQWIQLCSKINKQTNGGEKKNGKGSKMPHSDVSFHVQRRKIQMEFNPSMPSEWFRTFVFRLGWECQWMDLLVLVGTPELGTRTSDSGNELRK